jgi:uncharacterized membrane protein
MTTRTTALAGSLAAALALIGSQAFAAEEGTGMDKEKCYGIAAANHNDCASAGNNSCAGTAKSDYEKGAWKYVAKGTCASSQVKLKDGSARMGSLEPVKG